MSVLLSLAIVIPAAGACAAHASRHRQPWPRRAALCAIALQLAAVVTLWATYDARGSEWQFVEDRGLGSAVLRYAVGLDGLALTMVIVTALAGLFAVSWSPSRSLQRTATGRTSPYAPVLLLQAALTGAFLALDVALLAAFWLASLSIVLLLAPRRSRIAMVVLVLTGAATLIAALAALVSHHASLAAFVTLDLRPLLALPLAPPSQLWIFAGLVLAGVVTALVLPLVAELADRSDAGSVVVPDWVALVMLSGMAKLGAYAILRIALPVLPEAARALRPALVFLALSAALGCALLAFRQSTWRRIAACAGSSHACLALAGAFSLTPASITGAIVLLVTHTLVLCALFVAARDSRRPSESAVPVRRRLTWAATAGLVLAILMLVGVPAFAGFVALRTLVPGIWAVSRAAALAATVATLLAAAGVARMWWPAGRPSVGAARTSLEDTGRLSPLAASIAVALVTVAMGVHPAPLLWRIETSVARVVMRVSPEYAADVADCLKPRTGPLPPPDEGLPAGMAMAAPCEDGSAPAPAPSGGAR
jgi:NADH-quinone oxidoreductase subunit M